MEDNKVSVIIPVYNSELYIAECIESVINQTYKNIEIIAVNDGSNDSSLSVLLGLAKRYYNLMVINQDNRGPGGARNRGLNEATGRYVYFLDSDDTIESDLIEKCLDVISEYKAEVVSFEADIFGDTLGRDKEQYIFRNKCDDIGRVVSGEYFFIKNHIKISMLNIPMLFFDKEFLVSNEIRFPENVYYEDNGFYHNFIYKCKAMILIDEVLYHRRYRPKSIMTSKVDSKKLYDKITVFCEISNYNVSEELKELYLYSALKHISQSLEMLLSGSCIRNSGLDLYIKQYYSHLLIYMDKYSFLTKSEYCFGYLQIHNDAEERILIDALLLEIVEKFENISGVANENDVIGFWGTGRIAAVFFENYFEKRRCIPNNIVFLDSNEQNTKNLFFSRPVYYYLDVDFRNMKCVIVGSELYEEDIISTIKECSNNLKVLRISKDFD